MARKSIFVGSANETKGIAAEIARALADSGYRPLRWWDQFPPGSLTLDRLRDVANREADGAVLLFTKDDKTWYRKKSTEAPRDNVVLEFGLFVSTLDRDRTVILSDGARLPSDIAGITFEALRDDVATAAERVVAHFDKVFEDRHPPPQEIVVIADQALVSQMVSDPLPEDWHTRDCYFGTEGAKSWLAAISDPSYEPQKQERAVHELLLRAIDNIDVRSFVSFGPGDAKLDEELVVCLREAEPWLQYIPIDICDGLLQRALSRMKEQVRVPMGILADFEEGLPFINRILRRYATRPLMIGLLGNTLGNLDKYERQFLKNVRAMMRKNDYLLLDISLYGQNWELNSDRRGSHAGYGPGFQSFIAAGVARRHGRSAESVVHNFSRWIRFSAPSQRSDVPETNTIFVSFQDENMRHERLICSIRRYNWDSIIGWLTRTFNLEIVFHESRFVDDKIGDGVVLLKAN